MKNIIKKTRKEIDQEQKAKSLELIKVKDTNYFYWSCDRCLVAFFGDDFIYKTDGGYKCLNTIEKILRPVRTCMESIHGGDEDCFNKYYKFQD